MSKDRLTTCRSYISEGNPCKKKRIAEHNKYCQKCDKYEPRAHIKHVNQKKLKLDKIRKEETE